MNIIHEVYHKVFVAHLLILIKDVYHGFLILVVLLKTFCLQAFIMIFAKDMGHKVLGIVS